MTDDFGVSTSANLTCLQVAVLENKTFKEWFDLTLPRTLCSVDNDTRLPDFCVKSNLYRRMAEAALEKSKDVGGKMYVYYGPPLTGKTTAGKQLIRQMQHQKGDNYPSLYVDATGEDLYKSFREKLSVPRAMSDDDLLKILFSHLSNKILLPPNSPGWMPELILKLKFCSTESVALPAPYTNQAGVILPIIVVDQLSSLNLTDYHRLTKIYQLACDNRVLVYILTERENIANVIAGMNGDVRVTPVPRRFERKEFATQQADETFFGTRILGILVATGISWIREEWTREKLHEYVLNFFPDNATPAHIAQDGFFTFLVEGENPMQARDRANAYFNAAGVDSIVI
jgi:hypothetical protein